MAVSENIRSESPTFWQRTLSSLRYRNYRLFWLGSCSEHIGQQMETMAIAWLMKELTNSPYYLGLLAVCKVAPLIVFALVGGVLTDRVDRRHLLIDCLLGGALVSIGLLFLVQTGAIAPWHLLAAAVLGSVLTGLNHPCRAAIIPNLTPKEHWMNAIALDSISVRTASMISAPVAGFVIAGFGTASLFGVRAIGMVMAIVWLLMANVPPTRGGAKKNSGWHDMGKGLAYAATSGVILSLVIVFSLREFQAEVSAVFLPFFADNILHAGAQGYGYLTMAQGLGALVGLFGIATLGNYRYKGRLIIGAGLSCGFFLSLFPLSNWLILSVALLFCVSASGIIFENVTRTALQTIVPDEMRGRVMSMREFTRGAFGTWIAFGLGLAGEYLGVVTASVMMGVFLLVSVSLLALLSPSFRRL